MMDRLYSSEIWRARLSPVIGDRSDSNKGKAKADEEEVEDCKLVGGSSIDDVDCVVCVFYGCVPDAGYIHGVVD
jgi:hypothetical protein